MTKLNYTSIIINQHNEKVLDDLYEHSACTMLGYIPSELDLYLEELHSEGFLEDIGRVWQTTGEVINEHFGLTRPLPNDLNVFIIDLEYMKHIGEFAVGLRFERGYRWLDDVVDNARREN